MRRAASPRPPRAARALLLLAASDDVRWQIVDDLDERFQAIAAQGGPARATHWYWTQALVSSPSLGLARLVGAIASRSDMPHRGDSMLQELRDDLRYAARRARRNPLVAATTIVSTTLAVCATTAIFSVVNGLLLRPLPLPGSDRIVRINGLDSRFPNPGFAGVSFPNGSDVAARSRALRVAMYNPNNDGTLMVGGEPRPIQYAVVSNEFASVVGVRPMLGRWFSREEHLPGVFSAIVLTYDGWQRELGGDSSIVGRTLLLDGTPTTVVGILEPMALEFPKARLAFWAPLAPAITGPGAWRSDRASPWLLSIGRLRPNATLGQANAELSLLGAQLANEFPAVNKTKSYRAELLRDSIVGPVRRMLWLLADAVAAVLLVACANVAMLLLASADRRGAEFAVRAALGGSGKRVGRQVLTESFAFTATGGVLGIAFVPLVIWGFLGMYPEPLPSRSQITLDVRVIAMGMAMIVLAALCAGIPSAREVRSIELVQRLRGGARVSAGRRWHRGGGAFIAGQAALSVVLLFAAGVLLRSFWNITRVPLAFDPRGVLSFWVTPAPKRATSSDIFYRELVTSLRAIPGVRDAATSYDIPTAGRGFGIGVLREGKGDSPRTAPLAGVEMVGSHFFSTLRVPLIAGRDILDSDDVSSPPVAIVNQAFVDKLYPGENVIGRRVQAWDITHTIVGVVGDIRRGSPLWDPPEPEMYFSAAQRGQSWRYTVVRTDNDATAARLVPAIRAELRRLDPTVPLAELSLLDERLRTATAPQRFRSPVVGALGALALLLSIVGIYGIVAYSVSRRDREIGIRIALGEAARAIQLRVVRQALLPATLGIAVGTVSSVGAARWLDGFVLGVAPRDATTLGAVAIVFLVVTLLAAYAPARGASRLDPVKALRAD